MGMAPFVRKELIERADEIVRVARSLLDSKRSENLRKAANIYREATLSILANKIDKEADRWDAKKK
jgi:hypothetical protein